MIGSPTERPNPSKTLIAWRRPMSHTSNRTLSVCRSTYRLAQRATRALRQKHENAGPACTTILGSGRGPPIAKRLTSPGTAKSAKFIQVEEGAHPQAVGSRSRSNWGRIERADQRCGVSPSCRHVLLLKRRCPSRKLIRCWRCSQHGQAFYWHADLVPWRKRTRQTLCAASPGIPLVCTLTARLSVWPGRTLPSVLRRFGSTSRRGPTRT